MKSYGKVDETWDDAKFQIMIEDALRMAREQKKPFAVGQDVDGTAVVALSKEDYPPIFACAATAWDDEEFQEGKIELVDNVAYHEYSMDDMIPKVRDVLTKGMVEYGSLRFLSEGRMQLGGVVSCAGNLVELHGCPFIVGLTAKGIMVAPLSERNRFLDVASCVVTKNGAWSMSDKLPEGGPHLKNRNTPLVTNNTPARYYVKINSPVMHIYNSILESKGREHFRD